MSGGIVVNRAISLTQPWATLMAIDAKRIETRGWPTKYRGWIAIHASKAFPRECREFAIRRPCCAALWNAGLSGAQDLPLGKVIAVADLYACLSTDDQALFAAIGTEAEIDFGNYTTGRYGLLTRGVRKLREPIPMKGMLGIWRLPRPITEEDLL